MVGMNTNSATKVPSGFYPAAPPPPPPPPPPTRSRGHLRARLLIIVLLGIAATLTACSSSPTEAVGIGGKETSVKLPGRVAVVVPVGWTGDLASLVDRSWKSVDVLAVDPSGEVSEVASVELSGGGAANDQLADANRAVAVADLSKAKVPPGDGFGDVFSGARAALEASSAPLRVVVLSTGCLDVGGQRLKGADLSSDAAVATAAGLFEQSGVLALPAREGDVLVLAGAGACASNGVDRTSRVHLLNALCAATQMACVVREAEVAR